MGREIHVETLKRINTLMMTGVLILSAVIVVALTREHPKAMLAATSITAFAIGLAINVGFFIRETKAGRINWHVDWRVNPTVLVHHQDTGE